MADQHKAVSAELRRRLQIMQALEDAISFRLARVAVPCLDCEDAGEDKCDDHACDVYLIGSYRQTFHAVGSEMAATPVAPGSPRLPSPLAARTPRALLGS